MELSSDNNINQTLRRTAGLLVSFDKERVAESRLFDQIEAS
jgi:hypothetical protein